MESTVSHFGIRQDGHAVHAIHIADGVLRATVLSHGAVLQSVHLAGVPHNLTLGSPDLAAYEGGMAYFGAIVAPVANRLGQASAPIDGTRFRFEANEGPNTLHSGKAGTQNALWQITDHEPGHVTLALHLAEGAGGFPGNRNLTATYRITGDTLHLDLTATTDAPTLMNATQHGYWNLDGTPTWAGHSLQIAADRILPTDAAKLPTGVIDDLTGHPHDFRQARRIVPGDIPPLDHNYCLADADRPLTQALTLTGQSGVAMYLATTAPGLQLYDAAGIDTGAQRTLHNRRYTAHCGFAIEPQGWPDAPNQLEFPQIALAPGETFRQSTTWRFTTG